MIGLKKSSNGTDYHLHNCGDKQVGAGGGTFVERLACKVRCRIDQVHLSGSKQLNLANLRLPFFPLPKIRGREATQEEREQEEREER